MKVSLAVHQCTIERVPAVDAALCAVAQDERPLRGPAGRVDWRLCGLLSRQLLEQRYVGGLGEDLLISTAPRLPFGRLFLVGLGRGNDLDPAGARKVSTHAGTVVLAAGVDSLVLAPWDLTRERIEFAEGLNAFLIGCGNARARGAPVESLRLELLARNPSEAGRMKHDLTRIMKRPPVDGMELVVDGGKG
jgi:Cytosol aminopeptidase family, N-terminal domain